MKIQIVRKTKKTWYGVEKIYYAVYREDDTYKDLSDKVFSNEYWWSAKTGFKLWTTDYDLVQDVFAYLTGEKAQHDYDVVREGEVK